MSRKKGMSLLLCLVLGLGLLTFSAGAEAITGVITMDKRVAYSDEPITATWKISGGVPPYQITGFWEAYTNYGGGTHEMYLLPAEGSYTYIEDEDGRIIGTGFLWLVVVDSEGERADFYSGSHRLLKRGDPPYLLGDANGDAVVDIDDASTIVDHIVSEVPLPSWHNADVNDDKREYGDLTDLLVLIDMLVN